MGWEIEEGKVERREMQARESEKQTKNGEEVERASGEERRGAMEKVRVGERQKGWEV